MGEDKGKHDVTSTNIIFDEKQQDKWDKIKFKSKINATLNQRKVDQLWQLLE